MQFQEDKPIYLQISELICEQILTGHWPPDDKIPSVREMGMTLEVNPNTVLRTYDFLQQKGIIFNKRGIGYFVEKDAVKKILDFRREDFYENTLPRLFKTISLLQIDTEDILQRHQLYLKKNATPLESDSLDRKS
jgi:GntR family transcriptional regulator